VREWLKKKNARPRYAGFPRLLENPGKYLIFSPKISRPWKVLEIKV